MQLKQPQFIEKWLGTPNLRENKKRPNLSGRGFTIILARDAASVRFQHGRSSFTLTSAQLFEGYAFICQRGALGCTALEIENRYPQPYQPHRCNAMFLFMVLREMGLAEIVGKGVRGNPFRAVIRPL